MKCPFCRSEVSMFAEICPQCRSNLLEGFTQQSSGASEWNYGLEFLIQWAAQTLMLYVPFWLFVTFSYEQMSNFWGWLTFFIFAIVALVYRDKLPVP